MPTLTDTWNLGALRDENILGLSGIPACHGFEAASQTYKQGDVTIISSGKVAIGAASGASIGSGAIVAGRAVSPATGTTNADVSFTPASGVTKFLFPVYHATPASAVTAYAQIGVEYEMINHATLGWAVDVGTTTNKVFWVTDIDLTYPVGTAYAGLWGVFATASRLYV